MSVSRLQELEDIALGSQEHRPQAAKSYFLNKFRRSASPGPKAIATIVNIIFYYPSLDKAFVMVDYVRSWRRFSRTVNADRRAVDEIVLAGRPFGPPTISLTTAPLFLELFDELSIFFPHSLSFPLVKAVTKERRC